MILWEKAIYFRRRIEVNVTEILLIIGIICIIVSFFFKNSRKQADELEDISISLHQETNQLKKRLRAVEEELLIDVNPISPSKQLKTKPIHEIIVNQILSLHAQGYSITDIAKRSSLTNEEVMHVLQTRGVSSR
ncbi:hypothetical protein [Sporosarcina saromensis]|uniref:hypothetical protein n=1 Tax=Sporosarcina saromensis TaxID=359365 RepID=UPI00295EC313|nr:hypothetical protein [Sporosarcina saromensis]